MYSTSAAKVRIFLSTCDARKCVENIIFHASHVGFMRDTHNVYANILVTVNSHVECSFVHEIFMLKLGKTMGITSEPKGEKQYMHIVHVQHTKNCTPDLLSACCFFFPYYYEC